MHTITRRILLTCLVGLSAFPICLLAQREWIAPGGNTNWTTGTNWSATPISNQVLQWKGLGNATSNNNQLPSIIYRQLYFSGNKAYTITGNQITLKINSGSGGFGWINNASTVTQTITPNNPAGAQVIFNDEAPRSGVISTTSTGTLTIGNIGLGATLASLKIYGENTAATITVSGAITGSNKITIGPNESGDLKVNTRAIFTGNNAAFTGPIHIESGSLNLRVNNSEGISATEYITVDNNAALTIGALAAPAGAPVTISGKKIIINGTGISSAGALRNNIGNVTVSSDILLGNNSTITSGGGTLNLTNIGKYEGALDWDITFSGTGAINVLNTGSIGLINGSLPLGNLLKRDGGLLTISAPCNFTGGITLFNNAKLLLGSSNLLPATAGLTLQQNAEFRTGGFSQQLGTLRLTGSQVATNSTIVLTAGTDHTIRFASSRDVNWNQARTLIISNWTGTSAGAAVNSGKVYVDPFDASTPGLTAQQLSQIKLGNFCQGADLLPDGQLVPSTKPNITSVRSPNLAGYTPNPFNFSAYIGNTVTISGCNFSLGGLEVWVGGVQINPADVTLVGDGTITFQMKHGMSGQVRVVTLGGERTTTGSLTNLGYVTQNTGLWSNPAAWNASIYPLADQKVSIAHPNVKVNTPVNDLNTVLPAVNPLTIFSASSLLLTANDLLPATVPLVLSGGTLRAYDATDDNPLPTAGFNQTFGTLTVTANSKITLDTFTSVIRFDPSQLNAWTAGAILEIVNWKGSPDNPGTAAKIYVGTDENGLTADQLRNIRFLPLCNGARLLPDGELVPSLAPFISTVTSSFDKPYNYAAYIGTTVTIEGCQIKDVFSLKVGGVDVPLTPANFVNFDPSSDLFGWRIEFEYTSDLADGFIELESPDDAGVSPTQLTGLGFASIADGNWSDPLLWQGGGVPIAGKKATVFNEVALDVSPAAQLSGLEIKSGGLLTFFDGTTLTVDGNVLNSGTILPASGSLLQLVNNDTLTNNGSFSSGGLGTVEFLGSGVINGSVATTFNNLVMNAGTLRFPKLSSTPHPTVTGEFRINGGTVPYDNDPDNVGPRYGSSSKLVYATGATRNRSAEWRGAPGASQGQNNPGYPHDVLVTNGTTLQLDGPRPVTGSSHEFPIALAGNLTVSNATVKNDMERPLQVRSSLILGESETDIGTLLIGDPALLPDDPENYITIEGGLTIYKNSTLNPQSNTRPIRFEGLNDGVISQPGYAGTPPPLLFNSIRLNKSGNLTLNTPVRVLDYIEFTAGYLHTTTDNILELALDAYWTDASDASFVIGPVKKVTGESIIYTTPPFPEFEFPIGKIISNINGDIYAYRPAKIADMDHVGQSEYIAEYFSGETMDNPPDFPAIDFLDASLLGVWRYDYWKVSRVSGAGKGRVALPYVPGYEWYPASPDAGAVVGVAQYNALAGSWEFRESPGSYGSPSAMFPMVLAPATTDWVNTASLESFDSYFTIGWGLESVLPIKLLYFTGNVSGNDALLKWKIAETDDLKHFAVEHSLDGRNFSELGKVVWQENKEYGYRHVSPGPGVHYYRLQMVEKSGHKSYSRIEMLQFGVNTTIISGLVQNPVSGSMAVLDIYSAKSQTAEASVFDMSGRLVFRQQFALAQGKNNARLSLLPLAKGQYRMMVRTADGVSKTLPLMK